MNMNQQFLKTWQYCKKLRVSPAREENRQDLKSEVLLIKL